MSKYYVLIFISLFFTQLNAQSYPESRDKFVKEFQKIMSTYGKSEVSDFVKKELSPLLLESTDFPDAYFKRMVETCNLMETKRLKPFPEIYNYVFSVYSFVHAKQPDNSFSAWHSSVDKMLDNRNVKKFEDFIDLSAGFFSERRLMEETNQTWFFTGGSYAFEYDDKPTIRLEGGDLKCLVRNRDRKTVEENPFLDSIVVYNTKGVYDPILKKWKGFGGTINWQKVGLDKAKTFATIQNYDASLKTNNLNIDSVLLTSSYFSTPIYGRLSDKSFKISREVDRIFPAFTSFDTKLKISNLTSNVDYEGAFSLKGSDFVGVGTSESPAKIKILKEGKKVAEVVSTLFIVNDKSISCTQGSFTYHLSKTDSIYHPGLAVSYEIPTKTLGAVRGKTGVSSSPFSDSYHMVDIYVPKLSWAYNETAIFLTYDFGMSQEQKIARLESKNFYDAQLYERLQGLEAVHPLVSIYNFSYKYDEMVLTEGRASDALKKTVEQAKPILLELSGYGFITYDSEAKKVTVNPKLINFIDAKSGKRDFDNLSFVSDLRPKSLQGYSPDEIEKSPQLKRVSDLYKKQSEERRKYKDFGSIDLTSLEINLLAVDAVSISDPNATAVFPDSNKVTIQKNRNFVFNGWLNSGKIQVKTLQANYVYASNKINLLETESSIFRVRPLRREDGMESIDMKSSLTGITGEILVDDPGNRSGNNKKITDYPKLIVSNTSKIYYADKSIYRGAYDSTRFYFSVEPFTRDSLTDFKEHSFKLKGELTSAGIFPKFQEKIGIMPDYSFGFSTKAPADGYIFYGTKAKYDNKIVLSNNGLQGAGIINFIHSTSESKAFTFLPDSTIGYAKFNNKPIEVGVEYPDVISEEAFITYLPKANMLKAASTPRVPLSMFKEEVKMNGSVRIQPTGMTGFGILNLKDANLASQNFKFKRWDANADTSNFNLKNKYLEEGEDPLSFKTEDVNAHVSFKERKGVFKSNDGESTVIFPNNQYMCKMDMFTWFMDQESVELAKENGNSDINIDTDLDLAQPNFFSIHPKQDSLQFRVPKAYFSLKEKTIYCSKTEYIDVADARIYPDSMKVTIRKKAVLDPLNNSKIVANYITKYHTFIKANTIITARRAYKSEGLYPYTDADSTVTMITMTKIGLDTAYQTVANGVVANDANFKLSKQFDYYGDVMIQAANPLITFTGATRINHDCKNFTKSWMSFSSQIDPKNIQIPVSDQMKTLDGQAISAGIVWRDSPDQDSIKMYPTFLSSLVSVKDPIVMTASGLLQYDFKAKEFQISNKEKLKNRAEKGNFLALHTESCSLNGMGSVNLGMNYGEASIESVGTVNYNQNSGKTTMNLTMKFNLEVEKNKFEELADRLRVVEGLKPLDFKGTSYEQAFVEWSDQKTFDKLKEDYLTKGEIRKLPKEMESAIVVTGIKLVSMDNSDSPESNGLITSSENAYLVNLFGRTVAKQMNVKAVFQQNYSQNQTGDKFGLFLSIPGRDYYFDYSMLKKDGDLKIITTDEKFEESINGIKEDKRKSKNFSYGISTNRAILSIFMRSFGL